VEAPLPPPLEIPAKAEPKPLPDFPEPSPEEAALVYGFGTGRRAIDDEDVKEKSAEPKPPAAETEEEEEAAESFGTKDWRRAAMDFEVPEEAAKRPAFADEDLEPATFPSERDVPPRHVYVPEFEETEEPVEKNSAAEPVSAQAKQEEPRSADEPAVESAVEPAVEAGPSAPEVSELASPESEPATVLESKHAPDSEATSRPSLAARARHWMDMLSPLHSEDSDGGASADAAAPSASAEIPEAVPTSTFSSAEEHVAAEAKSSDTDDAMLTVAHAQEDEPPFEAEPAASEPAVPAPLRAEETAQDVAPDLSRIFSPMDYELVLPPTEEASTAPVRKDPNLVEPPPVDVTPEPDLVNDEPAGPSSDYAARPQETTSLHSYFAPGEGEPVFDEPLVGETAPAAEAQASRESSPDESGERVPAAASPSPEELSQIPFLTPPAPRAEEPAAVDSGVVDAVAQRLLEKLGPQLHEILSKGALKPLVENLVQEELTKKEK
jgi:hypothetical protein